MDSLPIALPVGGGRPENRTACPWGRCVRDAVAASVRLHRWGLGFRQYSFRPITRVLRDGTFSVFQWLPLLWHALFPSSFRSQVNPMTQEHSSEFLLTASGIQHRVPRRTDHPHRARHIADSLSLARSGDLAVTQHEVRCPRHGSDPGPAMRHPLGSSGSGRARSPASRLLRGAPTPCRPSRRTSFPSLGDTIVSSPIRPHSSGLGCGSSWSW
jgi:hypothetical protein